ncbi:MAG: hypothetical protein AAGI12_13440 [Pseudomonadota bacterium]
MTMHSSSSQHKQFEIAPKKANQLNVSSILAWYDELNYIYGYGKKIGIVKDIIVHGSYGDFTFNNFSDVELTIFFSSEAEYCNNKAIQSFYRLLNKFILSVDPLQHHGAFALGPKTVLSYDAADLPLEAYSNCWSMTGKRIFVKKAFRNSDCRSIGVKRLRDTVRSLENPDINFFKYGSNLYTQKRFLSNIFMIPTYLLNASGEMVSKKDSFSKYKIYNIPNTVQLIDCASQMRNTWPQKPQNFARARRTYSQYRMPVGRIDAIVGNFFRNHYVSRGIRQLSEELIPLAIEEIKELNFDNI